MIFVSTLALADYPSVGGFAQKPTDVFLEFNHPKMKKLELANLWYKGTDGIYMPTDDLYLTKYNTFGYPLIIDVIDGHTAEMLSNDIDGDGKEELVIKFKSGAHQTKVKLYKVLDGVIEKIDSTNLVSNMGYVEIVSNEGRPSYIEIKNIEPSSKGHEKVKKDIFYLNGNEINPIK